MEGGDEGVVVYDSLEISCHLFGSQILMYPGAGFGNGHVPQFDMHPIPPQGSAPGAHGARSERFKRQ